MIKAFVVGDPVSHSRSPLIHGHWLERLALPGSYERMHVVPDRFEAFVRGLGAAGFAGGNVTIPHKEAAFRLVDRPTDRASRNGAVNTLWLDSDGRLCGDNTDGDGFLASLDQEIGPGWADGLATALVLGAGGAARAIVVALLDRGIARVVIANRTEANAASLLGLAPDRIRAVPFGGVPAALDTADLVVNTTQLGMSGQPSLDLDLGRLHRRAIVADIVYVPLATPLVAAARARGLPAVGGLGMLLHQAVPGFERWFGIRPTVTDELRAIVEADVGRAG